MDRGASHITDTKGNNRKRTYQEAVIVRVKRLRVVYKLAPVQSVEEVSPSKVGLFLMQVLDKAVPCSLDEIDGVAKVHDPRNRLECLELRRNSRAEVRNSKAEQASYFKSDQFIRLRISVGEGRKDEGRPGELLALEILQAIGKEVVPGHESVSHPKVEVDDPSVLGFEVVGVDLVDAFSKLGEKDDLFDAAEKVSVEKVLDLVQISRGRKKILLDENGKVTWSQTRKFCFYECFFTL